MDKKAPISSTAHNARFIQAGVNAAFQDRIGKATDVEFNFLGPSTDGKGDFVTDQLVEARISSTQQVSDFRGVRLAVISAGTWHWTTTATENCADLPQSISMTRDPESMIALASLIVGNMPILRAQQGEHVAIVAVDFHPRLEFRQALLHGLRHSRADEDEKAPTLTLARYLDLSLIHI